MFVFIKKFLIGLQNYRIETKGCNNISEMLFGILQNINSMNDQHFDKLECYVWEKIS
jgi:hypothetical protein